MTTEITGGLVYADRTKRKLSRVNYGLLVGLSKNKIMNIEQGREFKDGEIELLRPFIFGEGGAGLDDRNFTHAAEVTVPVGQEGLQPIEAIASPDVYALNLSQPPIVLLDDEEIEDNDEFFLATYDAEDHIVVDLAVNRKVLAELVYAEIQSFEEEPPPVLEEDENLVGGWFAPSEEISVHETEPSTEIVEVENAVPVTIREKYEFKLEGYHVSNSELQTFKRCHRKWWLTYYRELRMKRPDVTGPRAIGTRGHLALSAYYAEPPQNAFDVFNEAADVDRARVAENPEKLAQLEKDIELGRIMLEGYFQWLEETGADDGLEVVGNEEVVEAKFADVLGTSVVLVGKLDLRVKRDSDGLRLFEDHKFIQSLEDPVLHLNEQLLQYQLLEYLQFLNDQTGEYAVGGLYNMLRKVKRTANAKPPFYARVEVRHNMKELQSYWMRVYGEVTAILELRAKLDTGADPRQVAYPTPRRDCSWDCDFLMVCPMFDDGSASEEMLAEYFERHDVHDHYYLETPIDEKTE